MAQPVTPGSPASEGPLFEEAFLRKLERLAIIAKRLAERRAQGERWSRLTGAGLEFVDHRPYSPGDDVRRIDWSVFGRLGRPYVRLYEETEERPLYLLLDTSASMAEGRPSKLGLGAAIAAALAYVALAGADRVALEPLAAAEMQEDRTRAVAGKAAFHALLERLRGLRAHGQTDLAAGVRRFLMQKPHRGVAVLLSDFFDPGGCEEAFDRLRYAQFQPVAVQITAPAEADPPWTGDLVLVDVETGLETRASVTPALRAAYRGRFEAHQRALAALCRRRAIPCFQVRSDQPFDEVVLRIFRNGGLLG